MTESYQPGALRQPPEFQRTGRVAYVDWLRVLALLGVFVIHVCSPFNPWDHWHIRSPERSRYLGAVVVFMAPWIMPLFMMLAGTSAWYSLRQRSNVEYVRDRVTRILIPLVIGILVLVPPQVYAERRLYGQFAGNFIEFYPRFFGGGIYPVGDFSWHHLWFLGYLFAYSLLALPLFRFWRGERGRGQLEWLARISSGPMGLLWLAIPILVERYLFWFVFGRRNLLLADWSGRSILFVLYAYGFVLAAEPGFGRNVDRQWRHFLALGVVGISGLISLAWIGAIPSRFPPTSEWWALAFWSVYAVGAWSWVVAVLGLGRRYLTRDTNTLERGRRAGLTWYLVHQPVIVLLAAWVVTWRTGVGAKALALLLLSLVGTILLIILVHSAKPLIQRARAGRGTIT
ncbi:MAG TPA: acyltransferase [Gemmatimonadaceae bacterium]|nr:acyltransferase [Gemmatimonadaceae bacterium]